MDSKEGMSLAQMAVTVLLVVLVIAAVVTLVYQAYSWFNSGTAKLGDQVNSIDSSAYSMYDDAQVTGTDVLTALKTYRDSDLCIVICNGGDADNSTYAPLTADTQVKGYNYCALSLATEGVTETAISITSPKIKVDYSTKAKDAAPAGSFSVKGLSWNDSTGITNRNTNFSPTTSKSSKSTYVRQGAQFYSNLIYDQETGEVCGILFRIMKDASTPAGGGGGAS